MAWASHFIRKAWRRNSRTWKPLQTMQSMMPITRIASKMLTDRPSLKMEASLRWSNQRTLLPMKKRLLRQTVKQTQLVIRLRRPIHNLRQQLRHSPTLEMVTKKHPPPQSNRTTKTHPLNSDSSRQVKYKHLENPCFF